MQIGQVPTQFVPDVPASDIRAITAPVEEMEILAPSLPPPAPVETLSEEEIAAGASPMQAGAFAFPSELPWQKILLVGGLILAVWYFSNPRR